MLGNHLLIIKIEAEEAEVGERKGRKGKKDINYKYLTSICLSFNVNYFHSFLFALTRKTSKKERGGELTNTLLFSLSIHMRYDLSISIYIK